MDRLDQIQTDLSLLKSEVERILAMVSQTHTTLHGDNGNPGLRLRVDRLEQRELGRAKAVWVAFTAAIGAVVKLVIDAVRG